MNYIIDFLSHRRRKVKICYICRKKTLETVLEYFEEKCSGGKCRLSKKNAHPSDLKIFHMVV